MKNSFFDPNKIELHRKSIASARAGNVIGGGDWAKDRIIPDIYKSIHDGIPIEIRNPDAVRPWQHVLDSLYGYLLLACKMNHPDILTENAWNFGPTNERSVTVKELCEMAISLFGHGSLNIKNDKNAPHEAKQLKLDITKAVDQLGWYPNWNNKKAIEMTIDWYVRYDNGESPLKITQNHIRQFFGQI